MTVFAVKKMAHALSNSCDSNPSNGYSYSLSYVYNMDTGLVEAHPATITETTMPAAGDFSSSSAASSREQPGGLVLPVGNGYRELTTGIGGGGGGGRNGPESGQFDNSQEFQHQGSANLQSEISQSRSSSFASSAQTTRPISLSVSIADNDNDLYVNVGDEGRHDLNGNEFLEKVVETSLGKISYSQLPKHQQYQALSLEYDMIEEENGPVNEYQFSNLPSYHDIVAATEILRYENEEHEANMISIIDAHKSVSSSMAPVPKFMNRPTSDAPPTTNYALSSSNLVVVDLPRRAEQCPENGEIIYVQVDDGSDISSAKSARMPMMTDEVLANESDNTGLLIPRLSARSDNGTLVIDDGPDSAESRVADEPLVDYSTSEKNDITDENDGAKMDHDIVSEKGEFREPPRISRQLGMFGTDEHIESQQKDNNDSPADSVVDFHNAVTLHSSPPTTSVNGSHRGRIRSPHCQLIGGVSTTVVMSSTTSLSRSSGLYDHDHASCAVIPACSSLTAVAAPSTQPIKPVALSASLPLSHQLIAYGMTGVSSAVPHPIHPQPMLPIPLPPLAVFAHPIHLFPATLPWHIHSHVSGPVPQRTSGRYPTNCPRFIHSTTTTNTTAALNSTARLAASYPLLKRGRRPRRQPLTNIDPTPQETNPDGTEPPITKRTEANARERDRVTYLNGGFEQLRRVLPWAYRGGRRVSKVDTLRAAISYIQFLQSMLVGAELSPAETIRLRNGIVLENTVRIVQSVQKAPYPILPPGYRFVNPLPPPHPPPPPPAALGPHPTLPVPAAGPQPTLPVHPTLPLPMLPPQPRSNLPPLMHLRSGYDSQPFQTLAVPHLIPSHSNGIIQGNESTALSWLINFQGNVGMPPIDSTERDVIMLGTTTQVSTNQNTKENHVTGTTRKKSQCKATLVT